MSGDYVGARTVIQQTPRMPLADRVVRAKAPESTGLSYERSEQSVSASTYNDRKDSLRQDAREKRQTSYSREPDVAKERGSPSKWAVQMEHSLQGASSEEWTKELRTEKKVFLPFYLIL